MAEDRSPEARLRQFVQLVEEEIADQDGGPNADYCWWCQHDVNGMHGPSQAHADECWLMRARALLTEEAAAALPACQESETPDEEMVPHPFNSRTPFEPGDDRDIWCSECEYHRDHQIHAARAEARAEEP